MSDADDIDMLAAEYALGTLPAGERAAVAVRAQSDAALAAAIAASERVSDRWPRRSPRAKPRRVWEKIEARINGGTGNVVSMERRLRRWRAAAIATSAIAAGLALFVGAREFSSPVADRTAARRRAAGRRTRNRRPSSCRSTSTRAN